MRYSGEMVKSMVGILVLAVAGYMACFDSAGRLTGVDEDAGGVEGAAGDATLAVVGSTNECASPQPGWIWCDDFEQDRLGSYFEYVGANGSFARVGGIGLNASAAMRARFQAGQVDAGNVKVAFGRTPSSYMRPVDAGTNNYRDVYWRLYVKNASGWAGGGGEKLSRSTIFAGSNWSQAMIAHVWSGGSGENYLTLDPASGTDTQGNLRTTGYNDSGNLRWFGATTGATPLFSSSQVGAWHCVEARARLNDAGQSNGVFELWVDGQLDARATNLNWVGSYSEYGINAVLVENYWNGGSPQAQERYIDNLVVSTQRIGCGGTAPAGVLAPSNLTAASASGSTSLALSWTLGTTYDSQILERKYTSPDGSYTDPDWARVRTLGGTVTSETDANLQLGATYTYRVIGVEGGVESAPSSTAQAKVGSAPAPVASVTVSPSSSSVPIGGTVQLTATTTDANGNTLTGRTISWTSSNTAVATVSSSGLATATGSGSATLTATSEGKSGSASMTVGVPAPAGLTAAPSGSLDISLSWTPGGEYDTQILERKYTSPDGSYTDADWARVRTTLGGSVTSELDRSLQAGATYSYRVIGVEGGIESAPSNMAQAKVGSSSPPPPPPPPPAPVATVTVAPTSATLQVGGTRQFTATLEDSQGNTLTGRAVEWTSSNTVAATVNSTGLVTARAAGTATITASSEGKSDSGSLQVQSASGSTGAWLEVDFEDYANTSALLSDCTTWTCFEDNGSENIRLDGSVGYAAGGLTKTMRYDYLHGGNGCTSITNSRQLKLPTQTREIWAEVVVRWSDNFTTTNNACVPNDHKLIFGNTAKGNTGRWGFYVGSDTGPDHTLMIERPGLPLRGAYYLNGGPQNNSEPRASELWDGDWHVIRLHFRHSSGNATGDGRLRAWIDGVLYHDEVVNTPTSDGGPDLLRALTLGRNKDDGPAGVLMSLWWARVRIWNTSPGW